MAQLDKLLKGASNPSQAILLLAASLKSSLLRPMLNHLRAVGDLGELIRSQKRRSRSRGSHERRYSSKSRSRWSESRI